VTGGSSGGGAEVALRLAELGMDVAILDPARESCAGVVGRITDRGGRAMAITADVADSKAVESALAEVTSAWGDPNVLVNVVGATGGQPLCGMSDEQWEAATGHPLRGAFVASRLMLDSMLEVGWGRIVTVAPPLAGVSEHSTLRAGLEGFTRTIALELEAFGVTANLIAPRRPQVGMHPDRVPDDSPDDAARYAQAAADAVPVLLSAEAAAVSGQIVYVSAGTND
jgi:3-oxoacyl-[acyl-carrier protein] reductase